jgi:hypothetical protein
VARGTSPGVAEQKALRILDLAVTKQATMLAFERIFLLFGFVFLLSLPLLLFMRRRYGGPDAGPAH